jgi:hypothetical protein
MTLDTSAHCRDDDLFTIKLIQTAFKGVLLWTCRI